MVIASHCIVDLAQYVPLLLLQSLLPESYKRFPEIVLAVKVRVAHSEQSAGKMRLSGISKHDLTVRRATYRMSKVHKGITTDHSNEVKEHDSRQHVLCVEVNRYEYDA
jgi:hypothetical protein